MSIDDRFDELAAALGGFYRTWFIDIGLELGLFAAIPAVYFYNALSNRVKLFSAEMDDFALEFLNIAERNFT